MVRFATPVTLRLNRGDVLPWEQASARVKVVSGTAWITQRDDLVDHFLHHGQSFELRRGHGVLISAEQELWLRFEGEAGQRSPGSTLWTRLCHWLTGRSSAPATVTG